MSLVSLVSVVSLRGVSSTGVSGDSARDTDTTGARDGAGVRAGVLAGAEAMVEAEAEAEVDVVVEIGTGPRPLASDAVLAVVTPEWLGTTLSEGETSAEWGPKRLEVWYWERLSGHDSGDRSRVTDTRAALGVIPAGAGSRIPVLALAPALVLAPAVAVAPVGVRLASPVPALALVPAVRPLPLLPLPPPPPPPPPPLLSGPATVTTGGVPPMRAIRATASGDGAWAVWAVWTVDEGRTLGGALDPAGVTVTGGDVIGTTDEGDADDDVDDDEDDKDDDEDALMCDDDGDDDDEADAALMCGDTPVRADADGGEVALTAALLLGAIALTAAG